MKTIGFASGADLLVLIDSSGGCGSSSVVIQAAM